MTPHFFTSPADFRHWLDQHHEQEKDIWVGLYKKKSGKTGITYEEAVEQGLCFGWIDSLTKTVDEESYMIRFSPRKANSHWTETNVKKTLALKAKGLMHVSGWNIFEARKQ